jgi:beta-glucanase (GH16 family)
VEIKDNKMQLNYLTSVIFSKEKFKYGYFECKAKAPSGQGLWPAFWLYGGEPNEEIDFMEMKGERHNQVHVDIHCPNKCDKIKMKGLPINKSWGAWLKFNKKLVDEWVIYSGLWEPGRVTFYVNGDAVAEYLGDFKTSMHLITNLSFGIDNGPFKPGINKKTVLPNSFEVDYIRVWKNPTDSLSLKSKPNVYFGTDEIRVFNPIKKTEVKNRKNHMFQRKSLKKEAGFVTVMPTKNKSIQLTKNGNRLGDVLIEILDQKSLVLLSKTIKTDAETIDFSSLKRGNYVIQIKHNNQISKAPFVY